MPKIDCVRERIVDELEIGKILNAAQDDPKLLLAVAIAWETGARIGEIVQLRQKDFSEEGDLWLISVPTLKQRVKIHGQAPKRNLKIKKDGVYDAVIKPMLDRQKDPNIPLFLNNSQETLRNKLKRRYPDVYFHWFRHSRATIWSRKYPIFTLQYAMGWQDIRMANIYVHQEQMSNKMGVLELET
jgi:integrase